MCLAVTAAGQTVAPLPQGAVPLDPGGAVPEVVLSGVRPFDIQATVVRGQPTPQPRCAPIAIGQTITGGLASTDPESTRRPGSFADCYTFDGRAGEPISIKLLAPNDFDTFLYLVGPDGRVVDSDDDCQGIGHNSCIPRTAVQGDGLLFLPATGTFTIEVTTFSPRARTDYTLTLGPVPPPPPGCASITVGQTVTGALAPTDPPSARRPGSFADCYTFSGRAGDQISIQMRAPGFDTFLSLIGPDGQVVDSNDDCQGIGFDSCIPRTAVQGGSLLALPAAGTYTIEATSALPMVRGDYTVAISGPPPPPATGCATITVAQTLTGALAPTDPPSARRPGSFADCYTFSGRAGEQISIQMRAPGFDTFLSLIGPDGQVVDSNDDCQGIGFDSCIPRTAVQGGGFLALPSSGAYTIDATSLFPRVRGDYTLTLSAGGAAPPPLTGCTTISPGQTITRVLGSGSQESPRRPGRLADCYAFTARAGDRVGVEMRATFDTFLYLVGPAGQVVDSNDDCPGEGTNSCLPAGTGREGGLSLPGPGTYTLEATSFLAGARGEYSLKLSSPAATLRSAQTTPASSSNVAQDLADALTQVAGTQVKLTQNRDAAVQLAAAESRLSVLPVGLALPASPTRQQAAPTLQLDPFQGLTTVTTAAGTQVTVMGAPPDFDAFRKLFVSVGVTKVEVRPGQFLIHTSDPAVQNSMRLDFSLSPGGGSPGVAYATDGTATLTYPAGLRQQAVPVFADLEAVRAALMALPGVRDVQGTLDGLVTATVNGQPARVRPAFVVTASPAGTRRGLVQEADGGLAVDLGDGRRQRFTIVP